MDAFPSTPSSKLCDDTITRWERNAELEITLRFLPGHAPTFLWDRPHCRADLDLAQVEMLGDSGKAVQAKRGRLRPSPMKREPPS